MKKYSIDKDFNLVSLLTFPVIPQAAPIAGAILGTLVNEFHSDKYINVTKSKIEVPGSKISVLVFEPKNANKKLPALLYFHGGGFIYKPAPYHYSLAKAYARYAGCKVIMPDKYASPALAESFNNVPKTYIETAEFDSLRDEGIAYANKLKASNVDVELYNTTATMHGFDMASKSKIVIKSIGRRTNFLRECFK